jgi:hypothetical protein
VFEYIAGFPPLVVFELVARFLIRYQHIDIYFPICQNPQHGHAHREPICSSVFSLI